MPPVSHTEALRGDGAVGSRDRVIQAQPSASRAVTSQGQLEALCSYLALPSNLFQLFQEHRDTAAVLLPRWVTTSSSFLFF